MHSIRPGGRNRAAALAATLLLAGGCLPDEGVTPTPPGPEILESAVAANPTNVLSAIVTVRAQLADSVAVRYGVTGAALDSETPPVTLAGDVSELAVLGLLPSVQYTLQVVAYGADRSVEGAELAFGTGALPADLPQYTTSGPDPSPGFIAFSASMYGLVIDNTGRVVWYYRFPNNGPGLNFQPQPNGRYVARPTTPDPTDRDPWVEIDPLGRVTRSFGCVGGLVPRFHDLLGEPDGAYWVMCDETRPMDLSGLGGVANAQVTGTVVQHVSATGALLFQWSPFDHFAITDLDAADRTGASVNWTHGNSLDLDSDGNLVVSFRSLSEITGIDTRTGGGGVLWRMGGLRNEFSFEGWLTPAGGGGFARQHGVRVTGPGRLLLLDNLGDPAASRAERYEYYAAGRTARIVGSYGSSPAVVALLGGTTQPLPGDRTLVAFGNGGRVEEYDAFGNVVWRIEGNSGYVFRASRIRSLYQPGVGTPR